MIVDIYHHYKLKGESTDDGLDNQYYSDWLRRYSVQQVLNITVMGHEDRYAGKQIEVIWSPTRKEDVYNKQMSGRYLIKSITHMLAGGGGLPYRQRLVLLKNAYDQSDHRDLISSTRRNIR